MGHSEGLEGQTGGAAAMGWAGVRTNHPLGS